MTGADRARASRARRKRGAAALLVEIDDLPALLLRRQGKSVFLLHHDGKGGQQRGTSKKEDVLDTVISLRRPPGYTADQGHFRVVSDVDATT
jgi:hypothetical protein